ncbi:glycosyl transferase, group 1 family protein [Thermosipho africanus TCF52B]|uniref:Glycosyl transferase, group 1 family protein n=2 Tax=Thermosipho TaxID=2420 RepID=B7IGX7_THEAB|nr:glycosyl transferase, group 1 family protein [Thermosipho africanus TCF52B]
MGSESSGIFIIKRLEYLSRFNIDYNFLPISTEDSLLISTIKKLFKQEPKKLVEVVVGDRVFNPQKIDLSFFNRIKILKKNYIAWMKYAKKMAKILEKEMLNKKYDLIHAHRGFPEGVAANIASKSQNVPYVVTVHGGEIHSLMRYFKDTIIRTLEEAKKVFFVSEFLLNFAKKKGYSGKNAVVIPNGYDPQIFFPIDKEVIRKKLGVYKEGYKYVGFVGNLIPVKRADKLAEIFKSIKKFVPNTKFIVVGDGFLKEQIKSETRKLDIIFTGRISQREVAEWMNVMDVMILPSRNEGWPCVIVEAQACGTCVIGSNNGGIPEAVGFEEYIVDEGKNFEERFANKVVEILVNGYIPDQFIKHAKKFTWENIVKMEIEEYKKLGITR